MKTEDSVMKNLSHPNIINLIKGLELGNYESKKGKQKKCLYIVLEYASGGELFEYVAITGYFEEKIARTYFHQIIEGFF